MIHGQACAYAEVSKDGGRQEQQIREHKSKKVPPAETCWAQPFFREQRPSDFPTALDPVNHSKSEKDLADRKAPRHPQNLMEGVDQEWNHGQENGPLDDGER